MSESKKIGCDYQGHDFGAHYPDSCCIEGYLWDLDSGGVDDNGQTYLDIGGEIPCPQCNLRERVKYLADETTEDGFMSIEHPLTTKMVKNALRGLPSNVRRMSMRYWRAGRREAIKESTRLS